MVRKGVGVVLVGAMVVGTLSAGREGEGNESYEICSSLIITSFPFSFLAGLRAGEFDLEGVRGSRVVLVVGVAGEPSSS